MWELASRSNPLEEFRRRGLPFLEGVHAAVREQVSLPFPTSIPAPCSTSSSWTSTAPQPISPPWPAGSDPQHDAGMAMMAHMPRDVQERFLTGRWRKPRPPRRPIRRDLAPSRPDPRTRLRPHGGVLVQENTAYAVPVFRRGQHVIGAIAVVIPTADEDPQVVLPVLVAAGAAYPGPWAQSAVRMAHALAGRHMSVDGLYPAA